MLFHTWILWENNQTIPRPPCCTWLGVDWHLDDIWSHYFVCLIINKLFIYSQKPSWDNFLGKTFLQMSQLFEKHVKVLREIVNKNGKLNIQVHEIFGYINIIPFFGKISAQPHTIVKQICFPNGNVLFLTFFSLSKNWIHNLGWGCAEILPNIRLHQHHSVRSSITFHDPMPSCNATLQSVNHVSPDNCIYR